MKRQISIDALNEQLFETIELLKNNSDDRADPHEKIDVETAKQIANIGKVIIDGYKVKAEVLNIVAHAENTNFLKELLSNSGFELPEKTKTD